MPPASWLPPDSCFLWQRMLKGTESRYFRLQVRALDNVGVNDAGGNLAPMSLIQMVHHDLRKSPRIFQKVRDDTDIFSGACGKMFYEKILKQKSRDTVPLN
jgi:hypothetical protein